MKNSVLLFPSSFSFDVRQSKNIYLQKKYLNDSLHHSQYSQNLKGLTKEYEMYNQKIVDFILTKLEKNDLDTNFSSNIKLFAHLTCLQIMPLLTLSQSDFLHFHVCDFIDENGRLSDSFFASPKNQFKVNIQQIRAKQNCLEGFKPKESVSLFQQLILKFIDTYKNTQDNQKQLLIKKLSGIDKLLDSIQQYSAFNDKDRKIIDLADITSTIILQTNFFQHAFYTTIKKVNKSVVITYYDFNNFDRLKPENSNSNDQNLFKPHRLHITKWSEKSINQYFYILQNMLSLTNTNNKSFRGASKIDSFNVIKNKFNDLLNKHIEKKSLFIAQLYKKLSNNHFKNQLTKNDIEDAFTKSGYQYHELRNVLQECSSDNDFLNYVHTLVLEKVIHEPEYYFKDLKVEHDWNTFPNCFQVVGNCSIHNLKAALFAELGFDFSSHKSVSQHTTKPFDDVVQINFELLKLVIDEIDLSK